MTKKIVLEVLLGILVIALLVIFITPVVVEPWMKHKLQTVLTEKYKDYSFEIGKVDLSLISSEIELEKITITSKHENEDKPDLSGRILSVKFKGIKLAKAIFKRDLDIDEISISNFSITGIVPSPKKEKQPVISHFNLRIGKVLVDQINLAIADSSTLQNIAVKEGILNVYNLQVAKQDTLSPGLIRKFNFKADEILSVSADSMYTYKANGISYSDSLNTLSVNGFSIQPNFGDADFAARHKYQTDRVEAVFSDIYLHNFSAEAYFKSGNLVSSYIEIGKMDMSIFRDKRKEFRHVNKPPFQELISNYPGILSIDSVGLSGGNITYTEHAEKAYAPGTINFTELKAKIYKISNDTIFKTEDASLELKAEALLMGKAKMKVALKSRLFDQNNTFSVNGTLMAMELKELNPMLEKNAFVFVTAGKIDDLNFSFRADNTKATGQMILIYNGLDLAVKNKLTNDTTAIAERFISMIANKKALDSNPVPGEKVRIGIIDYKRDPEKFVLSYCVKSILSGIKSSLVKIQKENQEKKTLLQKIFGKVDDKQKDDSQK